MANTVKANAHTSGGHDRGPFHLARIPQRVSSNIAARSVHGYIDLTLGRRSQAPTRCSSDVLREMIRPLVTSPHAVFRLARPS